jgi:hypothetical protein
MKNKFLLTITIAFFVFASLGSVFAKDIAYLAKDSNNVDSSITALLNQGGYTYDVIYQTAFDSTNFSNYKIILVGDGIFSDPSKIPVNTKNSVILNSRYIDDWFWSDNAVSTRASNVPSEVYVFDEGSSIVNGISESFLPYNKDSSISSYEVRYISKSMDAPGLNTIVADGLSFLKLLGINTPKSGAVVATIENGSMLRQNKVAKARGVFLGFTEPRLWTEPVKEIFYNSIEWAINGEDRDEDGFFTGVDCNDSNSNVNPSETEIPYNGVDENCDGYDLADKDKDGYCLEGYAIQNKTLQCPKDTGTIGTDCDDEDSSYNIGSRDLSKNCVNDAPVMDTIPRISVHETETAIVDIRAYDAEGDTISYSINDSRFVQDPENESVFSWETGYEDAGYHHFFAIVSDGEKESSQEFVVNVINRNKAPDFLEDIPIQEWEEDTNHTLNLSSCFNDIDGDNLTYFVSSTSSDTHIRISQIVDGVVYFTVAKDWYGEDWIIFEARDSINVQQTNNITLRVLPVNDAPRLLEEIGTVVMEEDEIYYLDLSDYIYDPDSELNYTFASTAHINLSMDGNVLIIHPEENWNGEESSAITASDGEFELTDNFSIKVIPVNDAPQLEPIEDKFLLAGEKVTITPSATDTEGDAITYSVNDARFIPEDANNNSFSWQTGEEDFGVYNFDVRAYDGASYGHTNAKVNVMQKIFINELVWENNGWVEVYNPESVPFILDNCTLSNGNKELTLQGTLAGNGFAAFDWDALESTGEIELVCHDVLLDLVDYSEFNSGNSFGRKTDGLNNESGDSFKIFDYPTKGLSNTADITKPEMELNSPENNTLFTNDREVLFEFTPTDNLAEEMQCRIIANSQVLETDNFQNNTKGSFYIDYLKDGVYFWNVECSDGTNKNTAPEEWMINISAPDNPILNYIGNKAISENTELKFTVSATDSDKDKIQLLASGLPEGATFTDTGNNNGVFDWKPNYNQSGSYTVKFTARDSTGLEDSETITILVGNAKEPPKFSDAEVCSQEDKNSSIELTIRNPDDGDKFEIGDTINGTLKIKNKFEDEMDFDVHVYLYDIKAEESVADFEDSVSIKDGKSESVDFSIDVPKDIENKDFAIYAYVEGDDNQCNSNYVEVKIERKKHEVVISDVSSNMESVSPGEELEVKVKAENLGREDEDVYITLSIPALNLSTKSDKINIEKYGDKDTKTETLYLTIPQNAKYGYYDLDANLSYQYGSDSKTGELIIAGNYNPQTTSQVNASETINLNGASGANTHSSENTQSPTTLVLGGSNKKGYSITTTSKPSTTASTTGSGNTLILKGTSSTSTSTSVSSGSRLLKEDNSVELGVNEKITKESIPNVKVEFNGNEKHSKIKFNQWVLLAVVLGLLVIVILVLIAFLRRNR